MTNCEPQLNIPLLRKVVEHTEAHPEEFDMTSWIAIYDDDGRRQFSLPSEVKQVRERELKRSLCNTTMCAAGTAVMLAGGEFLDDRPGTCTVDGITEHIESAGQRVLGISHSQAAAIFYTTKIKTGKQLRSLIEEVLEVTL
jgi:hypothetical protein